MKHLYKSVFFIFSFVFVFVFSATAHAATILVGSAGGPVYATANLQKSDYAPGATITADTSMNSNSPSVNTVLLNGGANGSWVDIIYSAVTQGAQVFSSKIIGNAPGAAGSYSASFTAGMNAPTGAAYIEILCKNAFYCSAEFRGEEDGSYHLIDNVSNEQGDSVSGWPGLMWRKKQVTPYVLYRMRVYDASDCTNGYTVTPSDGSNEYLTPGESFKVEIECLPGGGM